MKRKNSRKRWAVRGLKGLIAKGKAPYVIKGKKITTHDLITLQIVQIEQAKGKGFTLNVGKNIAADIAKMKRRGLVTYIGKKYSRATGLSAYARLALTKKGFNVFAASTMMGLGSRVFTPMRSA